MKFRESDVQTQPFRLDNLSRNSFKIHIPRRTRGVSKGVYKKEGGEEMPKKEIKGQKEVDGNRFKIARFRHFLKIFEMNEFVFALLVLHNCEKNGV